MQGPSVVLEEKTRRFRLTSLFTKAGQFSLSQKVERKSSRHLDKGTLETKNLNKIHVHYTYYIVLMTKPAMDRTITAEMKKSVESCTQRQ
jgi:hypothetical protein